MISNPATNYGGFSDRIEANVTFDGGTLNGIGDIDGTENPHTVFTVTGQVLAKCLIVGVTTPESVGGGNIGLGVSGDAFGIIPQIAATSVTDNTTVASHITEVDGTPLLGRSGIGVAMTRDYAFLSGGGITLDADTGDITSGVIKIIVLWSPISSGATITAA